MNLMFPKPKPRNKKKTFWRDGHEYLYGVVAHRLRRAEIYKAAGGEATIVNGHVYAFSPAKCQGCERSHLVWWDEGEWHHNVKSYGGRRCDCAACGLWTCSEWHRKHHNRIIQWTNRSLARAQEA